MTPSQAIPIARIRLDGGTQPRASLSYEVVQDYCDAMQAGAKFPPVVVFYDGADYWLADGFHRVKAAYAANCDAIECDLHQGTQEDAQWYSFSANKTNGLRRTTKDKQRAVRAALLHEKSRALSDSCIARHVGVDSQTVTNWRHKMESSSEIRKIDSRTVTRRRKTYQQNTSNIGRKRQNAAVSDAPPLTAEPAGDQHEDHAGRRTTRSERIDQMSRSIVSFLELSRHFAQLVGWLGETAGEFDEAERLLSNAADPIAAVNEELERKAIAADPLNATRLGIQENKS